MKEWFHDQMPKRHVMIPADYVFVSSLSMISGHSFHGSALSTRQQVLASKFLQMLIARQSLES